MATVKDVAQAIRTAVAAGRWQPGNALPARPALAAEFGVHPHTVASALRELTAEGLLEPPRGPAKVVRVAFERPVSDRTTGFFADPAWREPRIVTVETMVKTAPAPIAERFGETHLLRWFSLQQDGSDVVALSEGWYRPRDWLIPYTVTPRPDVDFYDMLAAHEQTALDRFDESVTARVARPEERVYFRETGRAPLVVLDITRVAYGTDGRVIEVCRLCDRASRYRILYTLTSQKPQHPSSEPVETS